MDVNVQNGKKGISGSSLKIIAVVTMLIDHITATILFRLLEQMPAWGPVNYDNWDSWYQLYMLLRGIGRMAFPIYCFLLVEGFTYTRSRAKYALRLLIFALVSEIPFDLAFNEAVLELGSNNVFFTLLLGLLTITAADAVKKFFDQKGAGAVLLSFVCVMLILLLGAWLAESVFCCDYGACGVLAIFAIYIFREYRMLGFAAAVLVLGLLSDTLEFAALFMLIPIYFYDGTRGRQLNKYFFYAFYPVHLLILAGICYGMGLGI